MSFHVSDDLLIELEQNIKKLHSQILTNIAHDIFNDPSKIPELKKRYLQPHPNTNIKDTIRPPRKYNKSEKQEEEEEIKKHLIQLQELSDYDSDYDSDVDDTRCLHMVRVNRKIRQCKHPIADFDNEFCKYHEDDLIHPFGVKKLDYEKIKAKNEKLMNNKKIKKHNMFLSDSEDDE